MRAAYFIAALAVAFLLGGFVEHTYGFPFGATFRTVASPPLPAAPAGTPTAAEAPPPPPASASTAVPHYSDVRGLQDAPRSDTPEGATTDFQRCVNTMILRREKEAEARTVCQKIISGISG